ncbi:MAG: DUF262 domain-containing protein [Verrucomicrobiota bacterium]|jgi:hypothetical protein
MGLNLYPARNINTPMASEIDIAKIASEEVDGETSLRPYEVISYPADFTLEVLVKKWNDGEIKSPEEQRYYVWKMEKASRLIESFLLNLPVPPIFLYQTRQDNSLLIVDGHQRLRSIACFFSGTFIHWTVERSCSLFQFKDFSVAAAGGADFGCEEFLEGNAFG